MILVKTRLDKSAIHGIGIFAVASIPKGTLIWVFNPEFDLVLAPDQVELLPEAAREQFLNYAYLSKKTGRYVLCTDDARFFNHDASPNVTCKIPDNADSDEALVCFAARDISVGEELTCNYSEFDDGELPHK